LVGEFGPYGSVKRSCLDNLRSRTNDSKKLFQFGICCLKHAFIDKAKVIAITDDKMI